VGDTAGSLICSARVAGIDAHTVTTFAVLGTEADWICTADPLITVRTAGNASASIHTVYNGRIFTASRLVRTVPSEELLTGVDLGCPGDAWTLVRYVNVVIELVGATDISYDVGVVLPS
jgi:hypothetical protein